MPEGDAVRRTAERLDRALTGRVVIRSELRWPTVGGVDLAGRVVLGTRSLGKHLLTRFDDGQTLHTHLRMDGSWRVRETRDGDRPGPDARVCLVNAEWTAVGLRLGMVDLLRTRDEDRLLAHLGPDVLDPGWDRERAVRNLLAQGDRTIGESLLDQRVVAGLGTIYLAESLWARRVSPWAPVSRVDDVGAVLDAARLLMQRSVAADVRLERRAGSSALTRKAYGREREPCPRCGTAISRGRVGSPPQDRDAYYCPSCQVAPEHH